MPLFVLSVPIIEHQRMHTDPVGGGIWFAFSMVRCPYDAHLDTGYSDDGQRRCQRTNQEQPPPSSF